MKRSWTSYCLCLVSAPLVGALTIAILGCSVATPSAGDGTLTVGFIYVGPRDDYGYNQAHAAGANAVRAIPGVDVKEEERVPDTDDVRKTMKSMIELDGAKLLFPTSFNYFDPHVLEVARERPDVTLMHCGGLWDANKHPANVGSFFGYIDECQYLSGIVAGHTTKSKKLGFVAGKPIPQVLRNVNAFTLGARNASAPLLATRGHAAAFSCGANRAGTLSRNWRRPTASRSSTSPAKAPFTPRTWS